MHPSSRTSHTRNHRHQQGPDRPQRSSHGGRHELGQNFLRHRKTIDRILRLTAETDGPILEIGPGDGALTTGLAALGRPLVLVELDEHRARELRRRFPRAEVIHADATEVSLDRRVIVGNLPFHLTTPLLRKLLRHSNWERAILLTQWEVARKRAAVGGGTLLTAQTSPWFDLRLRDRVPARGFVPVPSVDGGLLDIVRRSEPLVPLRERRDYERFVKRVFTARGRGMEQILRHGLGLSKGESGAALQRAGLRSSVLPREVSARQWAVLWRAGGARSHPR